MAPYSESLHHFSTASIAAGTFFRQNEFMNPQPLNYRPDTDPDRRVRVLVFVLLWILYCVMLAVPGYAAWRANEVRARAGWGSAEPSYIRAAELAACLTICLAQFLIWGWFWYRLRVAKRFHSGRVTSTFTSLLGIGWLVSAGTAWICILACRETGGWGVFGAGGVISEVMILVHVPRLGCLWPRRAE
jgi:hypothetical protein